MVRRGMGPFKKITTTGAPTTKKVSGAMGGDSSATQSRKSTRSTK